VHSQPERPRPKVLHGTLRAETRHDEAHTEHRAYRLSSVNPEIYQPTNR
jgi:hypothetical protein